MIPAAVILAAGASSRLGEPKALVDLGGTPALTRMLRAVASVGLGAHVVVGRHAHEIRARWEDADGGQAQVIDHPAWSKGRTGSIAAAVRRLPGRDLLIWPADVPLVNGTTVARLCSSWTELGAPERGWLAPHVDIEGQPRRYGHPIVMGRTLAAALLDVPADAPLSGLRAGATPLESVPTADLAVLDDLDSPQDLKALRRRLSERP